MRPRLNHPLTGHILGWLALTLLSFAQPPGRVAADTKFNLTQNPGEFLAGATRAWSDQFTLGQIQNQSYGYLFPQGPFFLLPFDDWILQRLWWALLMCIAFSGTLVLSRRMGIAGVIPAIIYALSPRILTTLTAISSEAWPVALVPWTLVPLVSKRPQVAAALIPVALMGAVNATATIAACAPAFLLLLWRKQWVSAGFFTLGCVAVGAWWLGPLVILGRYSPPFTDFIESAFVTTNWLNPAEVLRGTTSWAPFVDTERTAGFLLVSEPVFILATVAIAACGISGLARKNMPWRGYLVFLLAVGFALFGAAHFATPLFDTTLAPFRNLHKFDPLVRLPVALGVGWCIQRLRGRARIPGLIGVVLLTAVATAPAWSLRLLPEGTFTHVPNDWIAAGQWLDEHAQDTRTIVIPPASFARQDWGWTRDEPIQAVTSAPFAVRDAVPLINSEAIRGLDGQMQALSEEALRSIGVGAVLVRRDLASGVSATWDSTPAATFGDIDIYMLDPHRDMMITDQAPVTVNGGGEVLPLLWQAYGYFPARLVQGSAEIITDTPAAAVRNYGTLDSPVSAHLGDAEEGADVRNHVPDYPSAGNRVGVTTAGGSATASSSAADATAFGGANPSRSLTAAFDGLDETAWWPAPGDTGWIFSTVESDHITITATDSTVVRILSDDLDQHVSLVKDQPRTLKIPGKDVRIELTEPVGISALETGVSRIVEVPETGDTYFFQRLMPETQVLQRRFTTDADATWELSAPVTIDGAEHDERVFLPAGTHDLVTGAETITLTRTDVATSAWQPFAGEVQPHSHEQLILTGRAFNEGLRATVGGVSLTPVTIDTGMQAFSVAPGTSGTFEMSFTGDTPYRASLLLGAVVSLLTVAACLWVRWHRFEKWTPPNSKFSVSPVLAAAAVGLFPGAVAAAVAWAVRRFTLISSAALGSGAAVFMGLWLARAPWPAAHYAGSSWLVLFAGCLVIAALAFPDDSP